METRRGRALPHGFITGLHIDVDTFRGRGAAFAAIAAASVIVPTGLGVLGGVFIGIRHPGELGARGDLFAFAFAIGICLGVTALPVLGAILRETALLAEGSPASPWALPPSTMRRCGFSWAAS